MDHTHRSNIASLLEK